MKHDDSGLWYGWNWFHGLQIHDREKTRNVFSDTVALFYPWDSKWEIALPNGRYTVRVLYGDPNNYGSHSVTVESKLWIETHALENGNSTWIYDNVTISDGKLTVTSDHYARPDYTECTKYMRKNENAASRFSVIEILPLEDQFTTQADLAAYHAHLSEPTAGHVSQEVDKYTRLKWSHTRDPLPALSPSKRFTLFGSPKPLDVGDSNVVHMPQIREQSITHQERVFYNWAHIDSRINALVISEDSATRSWAKSFGLQVSSWLEYESKLNVPTYRGLFMEALKVSESEVIGMANGDLLFIDDLVPTLEAVMNYAQENGFRKVFMTGRRTNSVVPPSTKFSDREDMIATVKTIAKCGALFHTQSEDYFFVTRNVWDWNKTQQFVLGGTAFDNWIVSRMTLMSDVLSVDTTNTVTCVHQEHPNYSQQSGNPRSRHNNWIAAKDAETRWFEGGNIQQIPMETAYQGGAVVLRKRAVPPMA